LCRLPGQLLLPPSPKVIDIKGSRVFGIDDQGSVARRREQLRGRPDIERFG
jgi:hypothetical protein